MLDIANKSAGNAVIAFLFLVPLHAIFGIDSIIFAVAGPVLLGVIIASILCAAFGYAFALGQKIIGK